MKKANILTLIILQLSIAASAQFEQLIWHDEFDDHELDASKWYARKGTGCKEQLCAFGVETWDLGLKEENVVEDSGYLHLVAKEETATFDYPVEYTSGYIHTLNRFDVKYGRIEGRMKLPAGTGLWPAFWLMPAKSKYGTWPASGEIDIMEMRGRIPNKILGTIHYGDYWPQNTHTSTDFEIDNGDITDDFHIFAIEWNEDEIKWFFDDENYATVRAQDVATFWPFNESFYLQINLYVGGVLDVEPDETTPFPANMIIDYIRVYSSPELFEISGKDDLFVGDTTKYTVPYHEDNTYDWQVPSGVTVLGGTSSNEVEVVWGETSGDISVDIGNQGNSYQKTLNVAVHKPACEWILTDLEGDNVVWTFNGYNMPKDNPVSTGVNNSEHVSEILTVYDWFYFHPYNFNDILLENSTVYESGDKKLALDFYTEAPAGTPVAIQLEHFANPDQPDGTRAIFLTETSKVGEWETLTFDLDEVDSQVAAAGINRIKLIFSYGESIAPQTYATYYDNLKVITPSLCDNVAISDKSEAHYTSIAPMPVSENLNINNGLKGNTSAFIYDALGIEVMQFEFNTISYKVNVSELRPGNYHIVLINNSKLEQHNFLKL